MILVENFGVTCSALNKVHMVDLEEFKLQKMSKVLKQWFSNLFISETISKLA